MDKLKGLATGIGSLPHQDVEEALDLIFKYTPQIPFWPQLPKRDKKEAMVTQFSENFPCLKIKKGELVFEPENKEKELEQFYERIINNDIDYFKISSDFALGLYKFYSRLEKQNLKEIEFIKCQVTGPFTFLASINNEEGIALLHDSIFMQAFLKGLSMKALWQMKFFQKFGKKIILFFDEPYLSCFGSAYTALNKEEVIKGLSELISAVKSDNVLLGIHCCGNTDWSIFTEIKDLDIISFDAFGFLERLILYTKQINSFLKRGGILCWGIVPTQEFSGKETANLLIEKIKEGLVAFLKKGLDKELLEENLLLSPTCGLGVLEVKQAELILRLLSEVSLLIKRSL